MFESCLWCDQLDWQRCTNTKMRNITQKNKISNSARSPAIWLNPGRFQMHLWELPQTQGSLKSVQKLQIFHLDTSNIKTRQTVYDYYWKLWDPGLPDPAGSGLIVQCKLQCTLMTSFQKLLRSSAIQSAMHSDDNIPKFLLRSSAVHSKLQRTLPFGMNSNMQKWRWPMGEHVQGGNQLV